ncbi:MAG: Flp pilus assembly protein CpaB [Pseudomonadales bacterium]
MMRQRTFLLLCFSVLMAVAAVWVANNWLQLRVGNFAEASTDEYPVVVAKLRIQYGQKIERRHLGLVNMLKDSAPENSFHDTAAVEGKIAKQEFLPGDVIRSERIVDHLVGSTLAAMIEENMRAVSLRVNDVVGVAGFLLPGNRVDVLATNRRNKATKTETILQNIKVLAVDQTASGKNDQGPVVVRAVTLEVSPSQSEILVNARSKGPIQLTLRNPLDTFIPAVAAAPPKKVARRRVAQPPTVTVIRGTTATKTRVKL